MHVRKDTGFTAAEIRCLAAFPLVTLEKFTGTAEFGTTEAGTLAAARAIKAINPATRVLYYRNVIVHYGGYAANAALANVPGAFLVGRGGSDKLVRGRVQAYDLTDAQVRDWWIASARRVCDDPAIDGLFLDGNVKVLEPDYLLEDCAEKYSYFCADDGYDEKKSKVWMTHPAAFDRPLGAPEGSAAWVGRLGRPRLHPWIRPCVSPPGNRKQNRKHRLEITSR